MVAVFDNVPVAALLSVASTWYVTLAPVGKTTVASLMLLLPLLAQLPPPLPEHVQLIPLSDAGKVSVMVTL